MDISLYSLFQIDDQRAVGEIRVPWIENHKFFREILLQSADLHVRVYSLKSFQPNKGNSCFSKSERHELKRIRSDLALLIFKIKLGTFGPNSWFFRLGQFLDQRCVP